MKESEVIVAFSGHLRSQGWGVPREVRTPTGPIDLVATKAGERLVAEAKGSTVDAGLDMNTVYGQLLNRMTDPHACYAIVAPESALRAALRVPGRVRGLLGIDVYVVSAVGVVSPVDDKKGSTL